MLNLNLETAEFIKNADNTYTVYQPIGENSIMKFPRVVIDIKAEALVDESDECIWKIIERETPSKISKISKILNKLKICLKIRR